MERINSVVFSLPFNKGGFLSLYELPDDDALGLELCSSLGCHLLNCVDWRVNFYFKESYRVG